MLGQGLDLYLGNGERKGDAFREVLDLADQRSLQYFVVVGKIL